MAVARASIGSGRGVPAGPQGPDMRPMEPLRPGDGAVPADRRYSYARSRADWIRSGAGLFPCGFPSPPATCLNFCFGGVYLFGAFGAATLAAGVRVWEGLLTVGTPSSSPFDKTNCALDYDSPLGFAVILSSRWGKAGLWVDFRGSSFDGPS